MPHITPTAGEIKTPSQVKILPTANVLDYGHDIPLHLTQVGATEQAITFSTSGMTRSLDESGQPLDNLPHVYGDEDDGLLLHFGVPSPTSVVILEWSSVKCMFSYPSDK